MNTQEEKADIDEAIAAFLEDEDADIWQENDEKMEEKNAFQENDDMDNILSSIDLCTKLHTSTNVRYPLFC